MNRASQIFSAGALVVLSACGGGESTNPTPQKAPVASVVVSVSNATLVVGGTTQGSAIVRDAAGATLTDRAITWSSSANGIASVSTAGLVTAVAAGTANIIATSEGVPGSTSVTVAVAVASVAVTPVTATIATGATQQLSAVPRDAANNPLTGRTVTWSTSSASVATVSSTGLVTGVASGGPVTIIATSEGQNGTATITVTPAPVATVSVTLGSPSVVAGTTTSASAIVRDAQGAVLTGRTITWSSNNDAVATFDVAGTVTALGPGTATITATSEGRTGTANVTVTAGSATDAPQATAIGTSTGVAVTQSIGPSGGTLASADGRLTIVVPANAVSTTQTFSVQPFTNPAPGGLGTSYQLLPEGVTFQQPIQLAFRLTDDDLAGTVPDVVMAAYQELGGYWRAIRSGTYAAATKTLTISTTHFSRWSAHAAHQISPTQASVQVRATLGLSAVDCAHVAIPGNQGQTRLARCVSGNFTVNTWAVNSTPGGSGTYGFVVGGSLSATYTAPPQVPTFNPVAVSVLVDANTRGGSRAVYTLVSNILIFDDSWSGTVSSKAATQTHEATVKWVLQSRVNNVATYRPTGTVTLTRPPCEVTPKDYQFQQADGELVIDFNTSPATYYGFGFANWSISMKCPGVQAPIPSTSGAAWFGGNVPFNGAAGWARGTVIVQNGVAIISGQDAVGAASWSWVFTRDR